MDYLIVVDMQKDFVDGALGSPEAVAIVPRVAEKLRGFSGKVIFTRDTHEPNYLSTQEGKNLPIKHCIRDTEGWQVVKELSEFSRQALIFDKPTFGSKALAEFLLKENSAQSLDSVTLVGLCTDICVISNAMLIKAFLPEVTVFVEAACCAGVTPASHRNALEAMKMCQIQVVEDAE